LLRLFNLFPDFTNPLENFDSICEFDSYYVKLLLGSFFVVSDFFSLVCTGLPSNEHKVIQSIGRENGHTSKYSAVSCIAKLISTFVLHIVKSSLGYQYNGNRKNDKNNTKFLQ
jgi:hypothetical protein